MIIAQGGNIGGWSLYAKGGKLKYCYNLLGIQYFYVEARQPRSRPASTRCAWSSPTTAAASARAGTVTLFVDGKKVGEGSIAATAAMIFSADDGCDVGRDTGSPVSPDYGPRGNEFNGTCQRRADRDRRGGRQRGPPGLAGRGAPHRHGAAVGGGMRTIHSVMLAAMVAGLMVPLRSGGLSAQGAPTPDQMVASLKQSLAESQKQPRQYQSIETTVISLKGEEKSRKQESVYYGADGTLDEATDGRRTRAGAGAVGRPRRPAQG